jgi:CheY-like chemotaxis protein
MKTGPIVLVEDDLDDQEIFANVLAELKIQNRLYSFDHCADAYDYLVLTKEQPFIIFSDVNLPGMSGLEFKRKIDDNHELRRRSIPFIFYSTSVDQKYVNKAYTKMSVQGFFEKKHNLGDIQQSIKMILDYWRACNHPNMY